MMTRFPHLPALGAISLAFALGCAASTTGGEGGEGATSDGGDAGTGGAGATGGDMGGTGGSGGEPSLCAMDCSAIQTPQCNVAVCNEGQYPGTVGQCTVVPDEDGIECDDGEFCTVDDSCQAGTCVGGPQNDCGMDPPACNEVVCNESTQSCSTQPADNGSPCQNQDLCILNSACSNGVCAGGTPNDCFFAPVPNDCHVAVCNPSTGMCDPVPGNEGQACIDQNDLCSVDNTCTAGSCTGGTPKDCTSLTMGCFDGVCNPMDGQCFQQPIMPGNQCAEATDDCNVGICDMNGMCNPMPANEGGACDTDGCFVGQTCSTGTCVGGTQITACVTGDNCCPAGCSAAVDNDCCNIGLVSQETQLDDPAIIALINNLGVPYTVYNNNGTTGTHTSAAAIYSAHTFIILNEHDRVISMTEMNNLTAFVNAGGRLLVTGYDSLGSPTDANMAAVVNCTGPGDGPFSSSLLVTNTTHPIMQGLGFTLNQSLTANSTDHDQCGPGTGAVKILDVSGSSKLLVTDNVGAGAGKVIFWNGNGSSSGPMVDWVTSGPLQNIFGGVLNHMCQ